MSPARQFATRNKRYKLVELHETDCASPLQPGDQKAFPWAEYNTKTSREFYDLQPTPDNPNGLDLASKNLLQNCPEGQDPKSCLPKALRPDYVELSKAMATVENSAKPQQTCRSLGDGNLDLRVNNEDVKAWQTFNGKGPSQYDINLDGQTDQADLDIINANFGTDCMTLCQRADLNRDGKIDSLDMTLLAKESGTCDGVLCGGDLDGNGKVNQRDVKLMQDAQNTCTPKVRGAQR
jgi:hypothetical protein